MKIVFLLWKINLNVDFLCIILNILLLKIKFYTYIFDHQNIFVLIREFKMFFSSSELNLFSLAFSKTDDY